VAEQRQQGRGRVSRHQIDHRIDPAALSQAHEPGKRVALAAHLHRTPYAAASARNQDRLPWLLQLQFSVLRLPGRQPEARELEISKPG